MDPLDFWNELGAKCQQEAVVIFLDSKYAVVGSSVFSWHSKAQRQNYSLFSLKDNNRPTQVLDIYLETSDFVAVFFFFQIRTECSLLCCKSTVL